MKKIVMVMTLMMCLIFNFSLAQKEKLTLNDVFIDIENKLLYQEIINIENKTQKEIITLVKNWSGIAFANAEAVIVSETENQIVFNYITRAFIVNQMGSVHEYPWYIRIVAQFKDNKLRLSFYDDGNVYRPGGYVRIGNSMSYIKPVQARTTSIQKCFFNKKGIAKVGFNKCIMRFKQDNTVFISDFHNTLNGNNQKTNNDW